MAKDIVKEVLTKYQKNDLNDNRTIVLLMVELIKEIRRLRVDIKQNK